MDNKDLFKLLDSIQEDDENIPLKNEKRTLIIDGLNLFLRNFAVLNYINPQGLHIGGLSGFLRSLGSLIKQLQPTEIYIVFDGVGSTLNRKNLVSSYKSNRKNKQINTNIFDTLDDEDSAKTNQIERLIQYLQCLPVKIISLDKVEADDIIAFLSTELTKNPINKTYIVSSDKDFIQLVNEQVTLYAAMEKKFYTPKTVREKYNLETYNFLTYKSLMGDNSDKIPGVKGLGEKKLNKMFPELSNQQHITLEDIYEICESKYDKHIIYSRVILDFKSIKNNQRIMDLGNPILDENEKNQIKNIINEHAYKLDVYSFSKMYNQDGIGNVIKNVDFWLRDNFQIIDRYNKAKNK